jgi:hypothetical protein
MDNSFAYRCESYDSEIDRQAGGLGEPGAPSLTTSSRGFGPSRVENDEHALGLWTYSWA